MPDQEQLYTFTEKEQRKIDRWKRRLLDLTAQSPLLHMDLTPDNGRSMSVREDMLEVFLSGEPVNPVEYYKDPYVFSQKNHPGKATAGKRAESEWKKILKAASENYHQYGSNALYVTYGILRWTEEKYGEKEHPAPVFLLPAAEEKSIREYEIISQYPYVMINEALIEMLRMRFGFHAGKVREKALAFQKAFEAGEREPVILMREFLEELKQITSGDDMLSVTEEKACLGVFQYGQYALWNDLDKYAGIIAGSPLVRQILSDEPITGRPEWKSRQSGDKNIPEEGILEVLPLDSTQKEAVYAALRGESFVLHGPPGTGKSQTITLMLANLMSGKKSVLFAAEKNPALQVVYDRLAALGLEKYCMYFPQGVSADRQKAVLLEELRSNLEDAGREETEKPELETGWRKISETCTEIGTQLEMLHGKRICGFSAYELIAECIRLEEEEEGTASDQGYHGKVQRIELPDHFTETLTKDQIDLYYRELGELAKAGERLHFLPADHPLRGMGNYRYESGMQSRIRPALESYLNALSQMRNCAEATSAYLGVNTDQLTAIPFSVLDDFRKLQLFLDGNKEICLALQNKEKPYTALKEYLRCQQYMVLRRRLSDVYLEKAFSLPGEELYRAWCRLLADSSVKAALSRKAMTVRLQDCVRIPVKDPQKVTELLKTLSEFQKIEKPSDKTGLDLSFAVVSKLLTMMDQISVSEDQRNKMLYRFLQREAVSGDEEGTLEEAQTHLLEIGKKLKMTVEQYGIILDQLFLKLEGKKSAVISKGLTGEVLNRIEHDVRRCLEGLDDLREWSDYQKIREECISLKLDSFVEYYERDASAEQLHASFEHSILYTLQERLFNKNADIREFAGYRFQEHVETLRQLMKEYRVLSVAEARRCMLQQIREAVSDPTLSEEVVILRRVIENGGKKTSIREIIDRIPKLFRILKPCILLSPMTAAQYFPADLPKFETLVFDEASQIQTWKAIGLIGRSLQTIVAGDEKQMPPTAFFDAAVDDDTVSVWEEDQESILKDALAVGLSEYYLGWHYRSLHESLISFANERYYKNEMLTFPSPNLKDSHVLRIPVNGIYERGKTMYNRKEAKALTEWLVSRFREGDTRSYGVITFNKNQAMLISRLVEKAATDCPPLQKALSEDENKEPLFIRNLETVQGDERDVILFSVGYGPDVSGNISMRFGPLQTEGGWRRLNVAITRARQEMVLFSSIRPDDFRIGPTTPRAVTDLRDFLSGAATVEAEEETVDIQEKQDFRDGFQKRLCRILDEHGYLCDTDVGASKMHVDIAVRDPDDPERYLLGIFLHKSSYTSIREIYDREIAQTDLLRSRGWNLLQVWPIDWQDDAHREENRILRELQRIKGEKK